MSKQSIRGPDRPRSRSLADARSPLAAALLMALAVAVHAPTLGHRFLLDDGVQIFKNPAVTAGAPFGAYFLDRDTTSSRADYNTRIYRPLRNLAFRGVVLVGGVRPLAFGLANLALYVIAALLVLMLLSRVVGDARAAAWATALWVVLPVHVEPVAYASALGDLLSLALELGALLVALPYLAGGARWRVAASTALALAAMLAKEMAVTEPALLLLVAVALGGGEWRRRPLALLLAAHALAAVGYVALRTHVVGAVGQEPLTAGALAAGLRDAPWLLVHYAWISIAPLGHAASYRVPPPGLPALLSTLLALAATALASWRWRRSLFVGLAWFAVALAPVLHLVPLWADMADRFALFPTVGLALALAAAIAPPHRRLVPLLAALTVLYAAASVVEARPWRSDSLLWRYAVDRQPDAPLARGNLATVLLGEGRVVEAAAQLDALHALGFTRADVELKRAYVLSRLGRRDEAAQAIAASLRLDPANGAAHALAGQLALTAGDANGAARELTVARAAAPAHPSTGLLGYQLLRAREDRPAGDARVDYLEALQALTFDDAAGAGRAAHACLDRSPGRPQCEAALGQALVLQGPLDGDGDGEARALLDRCVASGGPDGKRCQQAEWGAR
jgi:tetratricopeptide (TPR) repeat protein/uncharacterized membrane protein